MAELDVGLIVVACIIPFMLIFFNLLVMAHYIDPVAAGGHFVGKLMILLGMLMAECTVLLLPFDVGNKGGVVGCGFWNDECGGLDLALLWQIAYCVIAGLVVVLIPFFIFYYENDDENMEAKEKAESLGTAVSLRFAAFKRSFCVALSYTLVCIAIGVVAFLVLYHYIAQTQIPYKLVTVNVGTQSFVPVQGVAFTSRMSSCGLNEPCPCDLPNTGVANGLCPCGLGQGCSSASVQLSMDVTYVIFLAALLSFVGWFIFSIYVGIGFVALPMDCFNAFLHRPKLLSMAESRNQKRALMRRADELLKVADEMANRLIEAQDGARNKRERNKAQKLHRTELNRFKLLVDMLEKDLEDFQLSDPQNYRQHYNPLVPYMKLIGGVFSVVLTLVWLLHIILYMLFYPPIHPFINEYLSYFDSFFPLFGTLTIGIAGLYLLLAASKGAAKFGTRFFLITVHPLEPHKTLINSFLFNIQLVLLCVLPTVQFCTDAFSGYARYTEADVIFGSQFKYIKGFRALWQYNVFLFMILGFTLLSGIYFAIFPSDRKHLNQVMDQIRVKKGDERRKMEKKLAQQGGALSAI